MQAISKTKHLHLLGSLGRLEELLELLDLDPAAASRSAVYNKQLAQSYREYEAMLSQLAQHISAYEQLYSEAKVHFLGKQLKKLKKEVPQRRPAFSLLQESTEPAYAI